MLEMVQHLVATYGYFGVAIIVGLESMGIPLPGETALISAALYAGATHNLNIFGVVGAAVSGAVLGDNLGYAIGRRLGLPLLLRYGRRIGLDEGKIKLGRYMFAHYGVWVVLLGRFIAVLRTLAAFLAGVNHMPWGEFFAANIVGAFLWATLFGGGAYLLGQTIHEFAGPIGLGVAVLAVAGIIAGGIFIRRNEHRLEEKAKAEFPEPLTDQA